MTEPLTDEHGHLYDADLLDLINDYYNHEGTTE